MKTLKGFFIGLAIAISLSVAAASFVVDYFPPPGMTYSPTTGLVVGTATGGAQGVGTVNAQGLYVNGAAVATGGAIPTPANPTANVGLTAVNGAATTYMRSDAAPALSQSIAPTWTALHTFSAGISVNGSSITGVANPTGTVGLTAVNGSATTLMRSDAAPALSQSISPTWSGLHTFSNPITVTGGGSSVKGQLAVTAPATSVSGLTVAGAASSPAVFIQSNTGAGTGQGVSIQAGTNSSDYAILVKNAAGSTTLAQLFGDGGFVLNGATGGDQGLGTINMSGCFVNGVACSTGGATGANPTGTVGLTAVNGVAGTYLRSDGAPPLSQAIAPTWSALHKFTGNAAGGQIQFGASGAYSAPAVNLGVLNYDTSGGTLVLSARSNGGSSSMQFHVSNSGTDTTPITIASTGGVSVNTPASGIAATINGPTSGTNANLVIQDSSANYQLYLGNDITNSANEIGSSGSSNRALVFKIGNTVAQTIATSGGVQIGAPTGGDKGTGTINAQGLFVNNAAVLTTTSGGATKFASGLMTTSGGNTCVINTNGGGLSSCTEAAAGRPVVNFTTGYFPTTFFCTATAQSPNLSQVINTNGINLNSLQVYITASTTSTNNDGSFQLVCLGN